MRVTQIFAPILQKSQQAYVVNILSDVSWEPSTVLTSYAISKAAAWSYTNSSRQWLSQFNIQVMGVHVGFIDTDLTRSLPIPKIAPETVAQEIFQGIEHIFLLITLIEKRLLLFFRETVVAALSNFIQYPVYLYLICLLALLILVGRLEISSIILISGIVETLLGVLITTTKHVSHLVEGILGR